MNSFCEIAWKKSEVKMTYGEKLSFTKIPRQNKDPAWLGSKVVKRFQGDFVSGKDGNARQISVWHILQKINCVTLEYERKKEIKVAKLNADKMTT